jgi:hypothetical protein
MRTRAPLTTPRSLDVIWSEEDDATFTRTRAALHDALNELELPGTIPDDETVKILRLPDRF